MTGVTVNKLFSSFTILLGGAHIHGGMYRRGQCSGTSSSSDNSGINSSRGPKSEILFLGTGSSLGTPVASHLMNPDLEDPRTFVSREAARGDPRHNRNYRCNPCIMVRHRTKAADGTAVEKNIVVDVGKTFREASVRWFPDNNVHSVDAILLTHGHADAIFGLDDVRNVQNPRTRKPMDVYLSPECLSVVKQVFFYLFPRALAPGEVQRMVSSVNWHSMFPMRPFCVQGCEGLEVLPFAVKHGEDMESMGFIFSGNGPEKVCYISDISRMLPESLALIQAQGPLELLIVDALAVNEHPTHYSMKQAVDLCRQLQPRRALLVGMGSQVEHYDTNRELRKLQQGEGGVDVQLAYDGLVCEVQL